MDETQRQELERCAKHADYYQGKADAYARKPRAIFPSSFYLHGYQDALDDMSRLDGMRFG